MNPLYNIGISAYRLAARIVSPWNPKAKKMVQGQDSTMDYLEQTLDAEGGYIWIHTASLGEFEQGRPLIEKIRETHPDAKILLSFFSPSGYEVRKGYDKVDAVCYLPMDTPKRVKAFLDRVNPQIAIFVKYEFWGNYLEQLKNRNVPTYIISAIFRPSQIFFKPWGGMFRKMLGCFTHLFVQNDESRKLLHDIGVDNVTVCGDTRLDRVLQIKAQAKEFPAIAAMTAGDKTTLVMGSSWEPDEDIIIPYFNSHPEMKLIIAPHEFDESRIAALMARIKRPVARYTQLEGNDPSTLDCMIIDCFGILSSLYRYSTIAYVGGGFGTGIHNVPEAAVYGIPVIFGPKHEKFREAVELNECGGGFAISNAQQCHQILDKLLSDKKALNAAGTAASDYIKTHTGAT
ncbi:MAG: 3-deoxy-D-manno-octulosonic acid transferase, partial [Muribaculaceae bacterium]|nr:3-deoxy-D-manno-octulosonic acid transferase [Muribaculaceae bacterium]